MQYKNEFLLLIKSIVYRIFGTICTMLITFIFTGNLIISTSVGVVELFTKILLYYLYDKLWNLITRNGSKNELS